VHNPPAMPARESSSRTPWALGSLMLLALAALAGPGCGGADNRPPRWSFIAPAIIEPSCATASCHSAVVQRSGVALEPRETARDTLVGRHFVIASDPDGSALMALLLAQGSRRMPPDFALPETDVELIRQWIIDGAHDD
jgi:hypothetical protein